ncbi:MAG: antitoxin [Nevskiales bacterium]
MRTTLDIDEDVLTAAKELGRREGKTAGAIISELGRRALSGAVAAPALGKEQRIPGFRPFASRGGVVTNARIDELRDEEGT